MFSGKICLTAALVILLPCFAGAEQGVTDTQVSFAQVAVLDGPDAALGQGMMLGMQAAFAEINANGGVHGRQIALESMDDGNDPDRSVGHVKAIIEGDNHLGLIGAVGTQTASATQPVATTAGLPIIAPLSGAGFLRDASLGNVYNVRATHLAETEAWIAYLVDQQRMESIALLYQDDSFGQAGLADVTAALASRDLTLAIKESYIPKTTAIKRALLNIRKAKPDAVVMVGAYKPVAEFIKISSRLKFNPTFVTNSTVGSDALAQELGEVGEDVIISQVVPFPWDASVPVVAQYQAALATLDSEAKPGFVSLEGYLGGRLAIKALQDAGADLTREGYLTALAALRTVDFGGVSMSFGPGDNQGMERVFLTRMTKDGGFQPVIAAGGS